MEPYKLTSEPERTTGAGRTSGMSRRRQVTILFVLAAIILAAYFIGPAGYHAIMSKPGSTSLASRSDAATPALSVQSAKLTSKPSCRSPGELS
jgi:hypothetical protein